MLSLPGVRFSFVPLYKSENVHASSFSLLPSLPASGDIQHNRNNISLDNFYSSLFCRLLLNLPSPTSWHQWGEERKLPGVLSRTWHHDGRVGWQPSRPGNSTKDFFRLCPIAKHCTIFWDRASHFLTSLWLLRCNLDICKERRNVSGSLEVTVCCKSGTSMLG